MINLKTLIDFLPPIFKNTDTYKVEGKGILERFLEVCGEYLEDVITPDIENTLDSIDIDKTSHIYLNYLWELLGEIPFGSNIAINKEQWDRYYDGTKSEEELKELSKNWIIQKEGIIRLDDKQLRNLLRYSLTLLKIRGTKKFFETLFHIYGIYCNITDTYGDSEGIYEKLTKLDLESTLLDNTPTDKSGYCNECLSINVDISTLYFYSDIGGVLIVGSDGTYFTTSTNLRIPVNTYTGINLYNQYGTNLSTVPESDKEALKGFILFRRNIEQLFDKYLPCNVKPVITYGGVSPDDQISLKVTYQTENTNLIDTANRVDIKVDIISRWESTDTRYQVSSDGVNWGDKLYESGSIFSITTQGDYYFRSISDHNEQDILSVSDERVTTDDIYRIDLIDPTLPYPTTMVFLSDDTPTKDIEIKIYCNGVETSDGEVIDNTGEKYSSGSKVTLDKEGEYIFTLVNTPTIFTKLQVLKHENTSILSSYMMGLPYGVSAEVSYTRSYYDIEELSWKTETSTLEEPYGIYGQLGGDERPGLFGYNTRGNVVNLFTDNKEKLITGVELLKVTPWAYKYSNDGTIIKESVKLSLVDIWYSAQPSLPINIYGTTLQDTLSDIEMLETKLSFQKVSTISVDYLEEGKIDLFAQIPGFNYGGVFLLHPNTEELISKGITPNYGSRNFYSNFLIVVVPAKTQLGTYPPFDFQKLVTTETEVNKYKSSTYGRGYQGLQYDRILIEPYYKNGIIESLKYSYDGVDLSTPETEVVTQFSHTKIVAFNVTPYNSNLLEYLPWESEGREYDDPEYEDLLVPYSHQVLQKNPIIIFMDRLAPFVNTQYMAYEKPIKYIYSDTVANGFYIEPIIQLQSDLNIWRVYKQQIETFGLIEPDHATLKVGPLFPSSWAGPLVVDPARFRFIYYLSGIELPIPYYILDKLGNIYLPGVEYSLKDFGSYTFMLLPYVPSSNKVPHLTIYCTEDILVFGEVFISKPKYILPKSTYTHEASTFIKLINHQLNKSQRIVRTTQEGYSISEELPENGLFKVNISVSQTYYFQVYSSIDDEFEDKIYTFEVIKNS